MIVLELILAQAITAPPGPQTFPWEGMAVNIINGLQVVLIPGIAETIKMGLKKLDTKVPRTAILAGVVVLGIFAETLNAWVGAGGFSLLRGAAMGFLAVAVREIWTTIKDHGMTGK
jgi:hypothetical protein